jgi:hypothetical protein
MTTKKWTGTNPHHINPTLSGSTYPIDEPPDMLGHKIRNGRCQFCKWWMYSEEIAKICDPTQAQKDNAKFKAAERARQKRNKNVREKRAVGLWKTSPHGERGTLKDVEG